MSGYYFTVFTPTYNRAHTLHRVYNSLRNQTYTNFEWLIIDDGSTDNTFELVERWQNENIFLIRYYHQENQGKHIAWNKAVDSAAGEYFLCADSDDGFIPESLETFKSVFEATSLQDHSELYGASALCKTPAGNIVGESFPNAVSWSDFIELYFKYKIKGDKWNCGKTEVHRAIRFEEDIRCSCLPEGTIWFKIAEKYKVILINKPLLVNYIESDSLSRASSIFKNAPGLRIFNRFMLNDYLKRYWKFRLISFINNARMYSRCCLHLGISIVQQYRDLHGFLAKFLWILMYPVGLAQYVYEKYRQSRHAIKHNGKTFKSSSFN